jgi:hypothetical protein
LVSVWGCVLVCGWVVGCCWGGDGAGGVVTVEEVAVGVVMVEEDAVVLVACSCRRGPVWS